MIPPPNLFKATRQSFIEDAVEGALDSAWADGLALSFTENGMKEPTRYGQSVEDEAEDEAASIFDELLKSYLAEVAHFSAKSEHATAVGHAMDAVDDGHLTDAQAEALNRIATTHEAFLKSEGITEEKSKSTAHNEPHATRQNEPHETAKNEGRTTAYNEKRDLAQFLLKAPLEFSDHATADLLNKEDQESFAQILNKLRALAAL